MKWIVQFFLYHCLCQYYYVCYNIIIIYPTSAMSLTDCGMTNKGTKKRAKMRKTENIIITTVIITNLYVPTVSPVIHHCVFLSENLNKTWKFSILNPFWVRWANIRILTTWTAFQIRLTSMAECRGFSRTGNSQSHKYSSLWFFAVKNKTAVSEGARVL